MDNLSRVVKKGKNDFNKEINQKETERKINYEGNRNRNGN